MIFFFLFRRVREKKKNRLCPLTKKIKKTGSIMNSSINILISILWLLSIHFVVLHGDGYRKSYQRQPAIQEPYPWGPQTNIKKAEPAHPIKPRPKPRPKPSPNQKLWTKQQTGKRQKYQRAPRKPSKYRRNSSSKPQKYKPRSSSSKRQKYQRRGSKQQRYKKPSSKPQKKK